MYKGTKKGNLTTEEIEEARNLGLIVDEQQSAVSETLEICEKLKNEKIDLSKIQWGETVNGKSITFKLGEIQPKETNINIKDIIAKYKLNSEFPIGQRIGYMRGAYKETSKGQITKEEKKKAEDLGLIKQSMITELLAVCKNLKDAGIDLSKVQWTKKVNGKSICFKLGEIQQKGIDIEKIINKNGLDSEYSIGQKIIRLRQLYNGTAKGKIAEDEKKEAENLGLIRQIKRTGYCKKYI